MEELNSKEYLSVIKFGEFMLYPELELKLQESKSLLDQANCENIVERCQQYLALLDDYRTTIYELKDVFRGGQNSASTPTDVPDRTIVREAIETTTRERTRIQALLLSFTTVSGYEAVALLNQRKYEGHEDWELRASGVKFPGGNNSDLITIQEAVDLGSLIRREDQVAQNAALSN